jgi:alginate O-acetyltransferase complex protein AlgI
MLFHTPEFLFYFLPAALLLHRLALVGSRNSYSILARLCLLVATLVFYGWTHTWWLLPFAFSVVFDFGWSILLVRWTDARVRRLICTLSVVQNICLLGYFKYWDAAVLRLAMWFPVGARWLHPHGLELPPGISFYTFESLSFVIDVYRREIRPPRNPLDFSASSRCSRASLPVRSSVTAMSASNFATITGCACRAGSLSSRAGYFSSCASPTALPFLLAM